jgi:hypothetical protein
MLPVQSSCLSTVNPGKTNFINYIMLYRFPIVEPDYSHTKLRLSEQGLDAIRRIENPIAIVGVSLNLWRDLFFVLQS